MPANPTRTARGTHGATTRWNRLLRLLLTFALLPLASIVAVAPPASAAAAVSPVLASHGFPAWYEDAAGTRVEPCLDPADPSCILPLAGAEPNFNPADPVVFPGNFPSEFFYAYAAADLATPGCQTDGVAPGSAKVVIALEGAFLGGTPANDRMVFGRIRAAGTGLCKNATYTFEHPFGSASFDTDDTGRIKPPAGTTDVGCVPAPGQPCDFSLATTSPVFGTAAAGGFLRWSTGAPAGQLGDGVTPHAITGGTQRNSVQVLDAASTQVATTDQFVVSGRIAGSLASSGPVDFAGQEVGTTSSARTVTVTSIDAADVSIGTATIDPAGEFAISGDGCAGTTMARDAQCTISVTFSPTATGSRSATLTVPSSGGVRSPLVVALAGTGTAPADAPAIAASPASLDFGSVRVRQSSAARRITIDNPGTAPLVISSAMLDPATPNENGSYRIVDSTCTNGASVPAGGSCRIDLEFAPLVAGPQATALLVASNAGPATVPITGTGTGGTAAVSAVLADNGFPTWYRDDNDVRLAQCIDPQDPNCIVLADPFYDPAQPLAYPTNFPSEFFYQVVDSDLLQLTDAVCGATGTSKVMSRTALEAAFVNGAPTDGDQMTFGRIRFRGTAGGLCPDTAYVFTSPYGADVFSTDSAGALKPSPGTEDVGCAPLAGTPCDFSLALSSRVLAAFLRWDAAVSPAAPAGYLGDPNVLHAITGAPYLPDGTTPANYFEVRRLDGQGANGGVLGRTDQFLVMGKLMGPLEADPAVLSFGGVEVGTVSQPLPFSLTNTGTTSLTISGSTVTGTNAAEFSADLGTCQAATLASGATCTGSVRFAPDASGARAARLEVAHSGLNNPVAIDLAGIGSAGAGLPAISFVPSSVQFGPWAAGSVSQVETVTVSNAGGLAPLQVYSVATGGADADQFTVVDNRCLADVAPGASCQVDVAFTPTTGGVKSAQLVTTDNVDPGTHAVSLSGTGSTTAKRVAPLIDPRNGFPAWYGDDNGVRLQPCLDATSGNCILLTDSWYSGGTPVFPTNFPSEFFYAIADSEPIATPGCPVQGVAAGTALLRVALEGTFANAAPTAGDQIVFGRIRVTADGLCKSTQYRFVTPYGVVTRTTDASGAIKAKPGTTDVPSAFTSFSDALAAPIAASFPRWNPNVAPAAPAGFVGDARTYHEIVGGTYVPPGATGPYNGFRIETADGQPFGAGSTRKFLVAGRAAGANASPASLQYGNVVVNTTSTESTVTVTNFGTADQVTGVTVTGTGADQFPLGAGTCASGLDLATDAACTVKVRFAPTSTGVKSATILVSLTTGDPVAIALAGTADAAGAPVASVSPPSLAFGTLTVGQASIMPVTVANTGGGTLTVSQLQIAGTAAAEYTIASQGCTGVGLAGGQSCTIQVRFVPDAAGTRSATLSITHNAVGSPTSVALSGSGVASFFTVTPTTAKFGKVRINTTKTGTVTVKNTSTITFTPTAARITGAQAFAFPTITGPNCLGVPLARGKTCNLTITFRPTAVVNYSATVEVDGDSSSRPFTVRTTVTGTGT